MLTLDYGRLGIRRGDRVLDVGCGEGRHSFEAYRRGASFVVPFDLDRAGLAAARNTLRAMNRAGEGRGRFVAVRGDANVLPFADGFFDSVICSETLEHIPTDRAVMCELVRVTRPGGRLGISVPSYGPERVCWALSREYHDVEGGHVRIYRERELVQAFEALGLRLTDRHYAHALHSPYWWIRCLFGGPEEGSRLAAAYHRVLVWDLEHAPTPLGALEQWLNPVLGKSIALYFDAPEGGAAREGAAA